jgi:hypothetical protein
LLAFSLKIFRRAYAGLENKKPAPGGLFIQIQVFLVDQFNQRDRINFRQWIRK